MDRASGSGVFARDPDAMLDLVELELTDGILAQQKNAAAAKSYLTWIQENIPAWEDKVSQDDVCSASALNRIIKNSVPGWKYDAAEALADAAMRAVTACTAWRIEGTLREFPKFEPINLWFEYPIHHGDTTGVLGDMSPDGDAPSWQRNFAKSGKRSGTAEDRKKERIKALDTAFESENMGQPVTVDDLAEHMGITGKAVRNRIKESGEYEVAGGIVTKKE